MTSEDPTWQSDDEDAPRIGWSTFSDAAESMLMIGGCSAVIMVPIRANCPAGLSAPDESGIEAQFEAGPPIAVELIVENEDGETRLMLEPEALVALGALADELGMRVHAEQQEADAS